MSVQSVPVTPTIEWDDSVVFVFSFTGIQGVNNDVKLFAGFVHVQVQIAVAVGSTTQVTPVLQVAQQQGIQFASDPQSWLDTLKNAVRNAKTVTITYEDSISTNYTTQTNQTFQLQQLFSLAG